jgi:predicted peptide ABC transporter, ATPase component
MENVLTIKNLSKNFNKVKALDNVSFELEKGEILGIVGESGSGKSTLAKVITRIVKPDGGSILFKGEDFTKLNSAKLREYRKNVQMVFQNPNSTFSPRMNIGDFLCEGMLNFKLASKKEALKKAKEYLELVKLPTDIMERLPHQLSGGQLQRVVIARALTLSPEVLIYDEATAALDVSVQQDVLKLMYDLRKSCDNSVIFICHELAAVRLVADRIIVMYNGKIVEIVESRNLLSESKEEYTKKLLGSVFEVK